MHRKNLGFEPSIFQPRIKLMSFFLLGIIKTCKLEMIFFSYNFYVAKKLLIFLFKKKKSNFNYDKFSSENGSNAVQKNTSLNRFFFSILPNSEFFEKPLHNIFWIVSLLRAFVFFFSKLIVFYNFFLFWKDCPFEIFFFFFL